MEKLLLYISERAFLTKELRNRISEVFERVECKKRDIILQAGSRAHYLYFVDQGVLHNYHDVDLRQVSSWFYIENHFNTAWSSFYAQKPSVENIECLEDCILYRISFSDYQQLIADFPAFGNFARLLAEEILTFLDEFSRSWSFISAKEKYQILQSYYPNIEQRVKLGLIASFLGISQETLSRVRSQI